MSLNRLFIFLVIVLIGGCSDDHDGDAPTELAEASLPGTYAGVFPCDGCPGIASTLWLRSDGRFFFRQQYPAVNAREATDAYSLGRWSSIADERAIELQGAGPGRRFVRMDRDTLVMRTDSDLEHRLTRDPTTSDFSAAIRMFGMMRMVGDSASFRECSTGFVAPVSNGGDFARFRHQYRSAVGRGEPAYVELEGRFSWSGDGTLKSLTIERFVTVKSNEAC
jgi:uncharacterized lipoprotein NlpE involved in copper resistance